MNRASKSISLALIGSSLILAGCGRPATTRKGDDTGQNTAENDDRRNDPSRRPYGSRHHFVYIPFIGTQPVYVPTSPGGSGGSRLVGGSSSSGNRTAMGTSTRGGFGATGHAATSGS